MVINSTSLSQLADSLWDVDDTRLIYGLDYTYELQTNEQNPASNTQDQSFKPLFTNVQSYVFDFPTIKSFLALSDNFEPNLDIQETVSY
ncbi:hypothetical protein, partial [Salmonella sp. s51884]|uniref:hypothetical protein n=1 Tax=Salmonella sp. s51884 TaxID=3159654 RepID=UPI00397EEF5D